MSRLLEQELIVLVDRDGAPTGTAEKLSSHHAHTPLHLAFSCYVFDDEGRFLATRRSRRKKVWPGVWSNTVCGHPAPGETLEEAVLRRLDHELGMTAADIRVVLATHQYRAPPYRGIVEHEFCPVLVARSGGEPRPNPDEVGEAAWIAWRDFVHAATHDEIDAYSWWCKNQLRELRGAGRDPLSAAAAGLRPNAPHNDEGDRAMRSPSRRATDADRRSGPLTSDQIV